MKRLIVISIAAFCFVSSLYAQSSTDTCRLKDRNVLNHLDFGVSLGTTGIGVELASPIGKMVQVRTGFDFMPHFNHNMHFDIQTYDETGIIVTKFDQLATTMQQMTGYTVDKQIDMVGKPTFYNFKLLVDVFPLHNKKWHFTGGFYLGPSTIATAMNSTGDMSTLLAVGIYNKMYDYFKSDKYLDEPLYGTYYVDPAVGDQLKAKFTSYGRMGIHIGDKKDGSLYMMEPGTDGTVYARAKVNSFKPYIGFGYGNAQATKSRPFNVSFDCGLLFWGGTPRVITHDGTDLAHDMKSVRGKVGDYVDLIKVFKVFPVIDLKISYRLF